MDRQYPHKKLVYHAREYVIIGWREWVALPELGVHKIKAKIDTGARTSALHAFSIKRFKHYGKEKLSFEIHPIQRNDRKIIQCNADLVDIRTITDSGGHREHRYVIETPMVMGGVQRMIEITLTNRSFMTFRMLLGRKALQHYFIIDPASSYHT